MTPEMCHTCMYATPSQCQSHDFHYMLHHHNAESHDFLQIHNHNLRSQISKDFLWLSDQGFARGHRCTHSHQHWKKLPSPGERDTDYQTL